MSIKIKIIIIVLPLLIATLVITGRSADLLATSAINKITNDFLKFKAEQLKKNADNQWSTLVENNLSTDSTYVDLTKGGILSYAKSLLKRDSEAIIAFDLNGVVVMRASNKTGAFIVEDHEKEVILSLIEGQETKLVEPFLGNIQRVAVGFYFEPFKWYILVTEEKSIFFQEVNEIASRNLWILLISIVVSMALLWFFAVYLTNPLRRVVKAMKDIIAYNDLSERVTVEFKDETGELAHTFNLMIAELEKAYNQIKSYAFKAVLAQKKEERIRRIFQKYVPHDVIDQFFANPESMLVGENRVLSILFSDIRSFTTISEGMMPDELVSSLNRYFDVMVDIIMNRNGVVDKYIGDAIMAFFGAPVKHDDDALQSVYVGLEMLDAVEIFNKGQRDQGFPEFNIGIGLNYGIVTVGNIGCEKKMDYTVIGDMVNLASRLEGLTKNYGHGLVISESVRNKVASVLPCRLLDMVAVKGKTRGVKIYAPAKDLSPKMEKAWKLHEQAMAVYYDEKKFEKALAMFIQLKEMLPGDVVADMFINRCKDFMINPPPANWNGVEVLKTK